MRGGRKEWRKEAGKDGEDKKIILMNFIILINEGRATVPVEVRGQFTGISFPLHCVISRDQTQVVGFDCKHLLGQPTSHAKVLKEYSVISCSNRGHFCSQILLPALESSQ